MSLKEKYADVIASIDDAPIFNRKRALKRFFLLMDFQDNFLPKYQQDTSTTGITHALTAYAAFRNIPLRSFFRWHSDYKKRGLPALLPKYGSAVPIFRKSKHSFVATIVIDTRSPLKSLEGLQQIIKRCRYIKADIKETALSVFDRYFHGITQKGRLSLSQPLNDEEKQALVRFKRGNHKKYCKKATAILMANEGGSLVEVMEATHNGARTIYRWLSNFNRTRLDSIKVRVKSPVREAAQSQLLTRVVDILHTTPSLYGIIRTSWTYSAICEAYEKEYGVALSVGRVASAIKKTGYSWRRARLVLTSPDPNYRAKVEQILQTLQGLKPSDRFFFIDEVGPYRVKKYGGRKLVAPDQVEEIPAQQKARGKVQFVAALEAMTNQMFWRFTTDKTATSMVGFIDSLVESFRDSSTIYFTWDAVSVHNAKTLKGWIFDHNVNSTPRIEVVPLPANSQFLNVIEAVFGGMKRAVICNSDYADVHEMQAAINCYFEERNQFYRDNPKRAGNKIWDPQKFDLDKLAGGLFKKM